MAKTDEIQLEVNNTRLAIVSFLEGQLFRTKPIENEVCHLTYDMWKSLKESVVNGEYSNAWGKQE